ncbi:hypothetical protein VPHK391_0066 [Vibrio phage K391]
MVPREQRYVLSRSVRIAPTSHSNTQMVEPIIMRDFYIKHMIEAHERGDFKERNNYAKAAGIDVIEYFYTNA